MLLASGSGLLAIGAMVHKIAKRKEAHAKLIQETPARKVRCYQCSFKYQRRFVDETDAFDTNSKRSMYVVLTYTKCTLYTFITIMDRPPAFNMHLFCTKVVYLSTFEQILATADSSS